MNELSRNRFQFSLRSLFAFVFVAALIAANWSFVASFFLWWFVLTGPMLVLTSFCVVRWLSRPSSPPASPRFASYLGWFAALLAFAQLAFCVFVRHRWVDPWNDAMWPRGFPYPDLFLMEIHDRWNRLNPAPPGSIKIHGEYFAVYRCITGIALGACLLFGMVCGYVFRQANFFAAMARKPASVTKNNKN